MSEMLSHKDGKEVLFEEGVNVSGGKGNDRDNFKIAAVVVTFNRLELLKICIEALRRQTRKLDEIIIVNNSSTDGTINWLNQQDDLTVITQENSGSAGGQHTGIKTAYEKGYDWIWCMDDDVYPDTNTLSVLIQFLYDEGREVVAISGPRIGVHSEQIYTGERQLINLNKLRHSERYKLINYSNLSVAPSKIFSTTFEGMFLRASAIRKIGLPLKEFFVWHDDLEFCIRLNSIGSIFYHPKAIFRKVEFDKATGLIKKELIKYLYGLRNLAYVEFHCLSKSDTPKIVKVFSLGLYYLRYLRLVILSKLSTNIKVKYIYMGGVQIYMGFNGQLGLINEN